AKNPRNQVKLYEGCIKVDPSVDPETQRIQPKAAPASVMRMPCCQVNPYCGRCSSPNPIPESRIPGATPSDRMNSGCMNPRNASSSLNGPTVTPKIATRISDARFSSSSFI